MMEIITALSGAAVALVSLVSFVATSQGLRSAIVNKLVKYINGKEIISVEDLKNHEFVSKLTKIIGLGPNLVKFGASFENTNKAILFDTYIKIICQVYMESVQRILSNKISELTDAELRMLFVKEQAQRLHHEKELFSTHLLTINSNNNEVNQVLYKLQNWKRIENSLIENNVEIIISSNRSKCMEYKIDIIFNLYSLGLDFLLKNGAESFNKLNGELDKFLK